MGSVRWVQCCDGLSGIYETGTRRLPGASLISRHTLHQIQAASCSRLLLSHHKHSSACTVTPLEDDLEVEKGQNESIRTIVSPLTNAFTITPWLSLNQSFSCRLFLSAQLRSGSCHSPMTFIPHAISQLFQMLSQTCASSSDCSPHYQWLRFVDQERVPELQTSF